MAPTVMTVSRSQKRLGDISSNIRVTWYVQIFANSNSDSKSFKNWDLIHKRSPWATDICIFKIHIQLGCLTMEMYN